MYSCQSWSAHKTLGCFIMVYLVLVFLGVFGDLCGRDQFFHILSLDIIYIYIYTYIYILNFLVSVWRLTA